MCMHIMSYLIVRRGEDDDDEEDEAEVTDANVRTGSRDPASPGGRASSAEYAAAGYEYYEDEPAI